MPNTWRQFDNPLNLTQQRAFDRLYPFDKNILVRLEDSNLVGVVSILTDLQIQTVLSNPSQAEPMALRKAAAIEHMNASGLVGRNISTVNNNAERDALMRAVCYICGITDENGIILGTPNPVVTK